MRIKGKSPKLLEKEEWARGENGREKQGARGEKEIDTFDHRGENKM